MKIPDEAVEAAYEAGERALHSPCVRLPNGKDKNYLLPDVKRILTAAAPAIVRANLEEITNRMQRLLDSVVDPPPQTSGMVRVRRRWLYELREALKGLVNDDLPTR